MPPRSKVDLLPDQVREELERRLIQGGFSGYRDLAEWLSDQGFAISKSSLHAWGQGFEDRLGSLKRVTEQARAIVSENPDDDGAVNDALIRLVQEKAYGLLMDMEIDPDGIDLPKLMRVIADLSRASVSQKRLAKEVREQIAEEERRRAAEMVEKKLDAMGSKAGVTDETRKAIRDALGIV